MSMDLDESYVFENQETENDTERSRKIDPNIDITVEKLEETVVQTIQRNASALHETSPTRRIVLSRGVLSRNKLVPLVQTQ